MPRAVRSNDVAVVRVIPSRKTTGAAARASTIAATVRDRGGWAITSASVYQGWTVRLGGGRYRIESLVSAFLEGPRDPGFVFNITFRSTRRQAAIERVTSTPWFQDVQARLGGNYAMDDIRPERVSLVRLMRGTTDPSTILAELHHVAAAIEGKRSARRRTRVKSARKRPKESRENLWAILDAVRRTRWRLSSLAQRLERQVQHDGERWHVSAGFIAMVESAQNHPGFAGTVDSWSRRGKRSKGRNPISKASTILRKNGYRCAADIHYDRWHRGLGLRAANDEIELLERAVRLMSSRDSTPAGLPRTR